MNSERIQGRLPEQGPSSCISKDKLEISSWQWGKCSPKFAKVKIKGGGKRFTGGMWGQHTKLKEFNIQALRWRHLGSNGDPKTKTRAGNPARPYLLTASLDMIAVFPLTKDWFLPGNGFHSDPSSTATQEGRHLPPNSFEESPGRTLARFWSCAHPGPRAMARQQGGCYWPTCMGCAVHCIQEGKVTWEGGSSIWTRGQKSGGANLERMWVLFSKGKEDARQTKLTVQTNATFGTTLHFHIPMNQQRTSLSYFPWLWYSMCDSPRLLGGTC